VREHFQLFGAFRGISPPELDHVIEMLATTLQLTEVLATRAGDLTGGQQRKLCIGLSLLGSPPIVIMDEPTGGVDVETCQLSWKIIPSFEETTTVVTSHALEEADTVSSRLLVMSNGRLVFSGTPPQLRNQFKCGYLLRIAGEDGRTGEVLTLAQSFVPGAHLAEGRTDAIAMPVDDSISTFLTALSERQEELRVQGYSLAVVQLEDMLLQLIESDEAQFERLEGS
jgi:ABC-type multidrug transport system ATPase subunit